MSRSPALAGSQRGLSGMVCPEGLASLNTNIWDRVCSRCSFQTATNSFRANEIAAPQVQARTLTTDPYSGVPVDNTGRRRRYEAKLRLQIRLRHWRTCVLTAGGGRGQGGGQGGGGDTDAHGTQRLMIDAHTRIGACPVAYPGTHACWVCPVGSHCTGRGAQCDARGWAVRTGGGGGGPSPHGRGRGACCRP